jgi:hypothetical protein
MPHRLVSLAILLFWAISSVALFSRDILPDLLIGSPPDLRSIALADRNPGPTKWALLVADDPASIQLRSVGQAVTETQHKRDGWVRLTSEAWFDSGELLKGTPFAQMQNERLVVRGAYDIDASGNLERFHAAVRTSSSSTDMLTLTGQVTKNNLEVTAYGPLHLMNWSKSFPYQPRGMVQNALGPIDRMPGLQVGQRWKSRMVSPITGRVEEVRVEVARKTLITWDSNPVWTLEVVTHVPPISARTWVRPDGLVLRQEAPFPFVKLFMERQVPDSETDGAGRPPR